MRSMIVSLSTATWNETLGVDVERDDERLNVYVSTSFRQAPIAFLRTWKEGIDTNVVSRVEVRDILEFHANLSKSKKKGRT